MLNLLRKKILFSKETKFLENFNQEVLSKISSNAKDHVFQKLYNSNPEFIEYFFDSSKIGKTLRLSASNGVSKKNISLQFPRESDVLPLKSLYNSKWPLSFEVFQKLYLDRSFRFPKNVDFFDLDKNRFLEFNRYGTIGSISQSSVGVNLIAGASETFQFVNNYNQKKYSDYNFLSLNFPFHEMNDTISVAKEGADFRLITKSIESISTDLSTDNINIDVILGTFGWHNLIYNDRSEEFWRDNFDRILKKCNRFCIIEIFSPLIYLNNSQIINFSGTNTKAFWGFLEVNNEQIDNLRNEIFRFNNFIKNYARSRSNVIVIPIAELLALNEEDCLRYFRDINHIDEYTEMRKIIYNTVNGFMRSNSKFFIPDSKKIPEYIYPLF